MIFNLLVLPLAAGYYILTKSFYFKFVTQRLDRQRLFFETVICAVFILIGAFLLKSFIYDQFFTNEFQHSFKKLNPLRTTPHSGMVGISFLLTVALTHLTNLLANNKKEINKAIKLIGNEFELMASKSFNEKRLVLLTLKNDKFYIGWVKELPIPSYSNYLRIIPLFSGYRDDEKKLEFTSHYFKAYEKLIHDENKLEDTHLNIDVVMPISEVITISFYDQDIYDALN
ncbi:hypothetical protein [Sphingobacterium cellulitidis]|uniref:hypothetical protein n=1 Tax=Sphingobacterium cellulitidis TaxID=1768011 RepID=UPI000B93DB10|nr:hypothetical protein CHT99_15570 [Sphingobacterium cellulitidis]